MGFKFNRSINYLCPRITVTLDIFRTQNTPRSPPKLSQKKSLKLVCFPEFILLLGIYSRLQIALFSKVRDIQFYRI